MPALSSFLNTGRQEKKRRTRKRGPKDGPAGMLLKMLGAVIKAGSMSTRELAKKFDTTIQNVNYHIRRLQELSLVKRLKNGIVVAQFSPPALATDIISRADQSLLSSIKGRGKPVRERAIAIYELMLRYKVCLTTAQVAKLTGLSRRQARRIMSLLEEKGFVVKTGGRSCPFAFWVPLPIPQRRPIIHTHQYWLFHINRRRRGGF